VKVQEVAKEVEKIVSVMEGEGRALSNLDNLEIQYSYEVGLPPEPLLS
jgi:hypothetical protein